MFCGRAVIAAAAGGAVELVESGVTGFLVPPGEPKQLAQVILTCREQPETVAKIANQARLEASQRFDLSQTNQEIAQLLEELVG